MFSDSTWQDNNSAKVFNQTPEFVFEGASGNNGSIRLVNWDHRHMRNPGFYNSSFGDNTPSTDTTPYQTVTLPAGSSSGTMIQVDTNIEFSPNVMGTWMMNYTDGGGSKYAHYFIMGENGSTPSVVLILKKYRRRQAYGDHCIGDKRQG